MSKTAWNNHFLFITGILKFGSIKSASHWDNLRCAQYLLSAHHVAFDPLIAFVPSVLAFACSFSTGSANTRESVVTSPLHNNNNN